MLEYKTILEFSRPDFVTEIHAIRTQEQGTLKVSVGVKKFDEEVTIELSGFNHLAKAISSLLEAERGVISKEVNSGKEFGSIKIECWVDERYSEYWCDTARSLD